MLVAGAVDGGGGGDITKVGGSVNEESVWDGGIVSDWGSVIGQSSGGAPVGRAVINEEGGEEGGEGSVATGKGEAGVVVSWDMPGGISGGLEAPGGLAGSMGVTMVSGTTIKGSESESGVVLEG